jgi:hypothetical protein
MRGMGMPKVDRLTIAVAKNGDAFDVSTNSFGETVAFRLSDGAQVDFGRDDRHNLAVAYIMNDFPGFPEGTHYFNDFYIGD